MIAVLQFWTQILTRMKRTVIVRPVTGAGRKTGLVGAELVEAGLAEAGLMWEELVEAGQQV